MARPFVVCAANVFCLFLVAFLLLAKCQAGRVNVAQSLTTLKENQRSGLLQVELTEVAVGNAVNVTCVQLQFDARKARVSFDETVIQINSGSGNVTASIISPGEAVMVSCYGISQNNGVQYLQINSTGRTGSVIVSKAPAISICSEQIYVKAYSSEVQMIDVTLSESAKKAVIVECFITGATSSSSLQVQFDRATVPATQTTVKVPFRVTRSGTSVKVACRAQDQTCLTSPTTTISASSLPPSATSSITGQVTRSILTSSLTRNITISILNSSNIAPSVVNNSSIFASLYVAANSTSISVSGSSSTASSNVATASSTSNGLNSTLVSSPPVRLSSSSSHTATLSSSSSFVPSSSLILASNSSPISTNNTLSNSTLPSGSNSTLASSILGSSSSVSKSTLAFSIPVAPTSTVTPTLPPTATPVSNLGSCQYLFNTSVGLSVTFTAENPSIKAYPEASELQSLYKHLSYVVLDRALEGTSNMDLQCGIKSILTSRADATVCDVTTGLPINSNRMVVLSQVTLELLESKITFKPGEITKNITIQVKRLSNESYFQLFHAFCCAPNSNSKYKGTTVSVYLWIESMGNVAFSWSNVPGQSQRTITPVNNLDYSCPCNLKTNVCDINCCCDKDCLSHELSRFNCLSGAFGGRQVKAFEFSCQATWPDRKDWTPVLCVVTNNSPFLGYFYQYTSPALAVTSADYNTLISGRSFYDFEEKEARNNLQSNTIGYTYGSPIRTNIGFLALPSRFPDNACLFTSVRYLIDRKTHCIHKANRQTCTEASFNALNYILPTGLRYPACSVPGILDGQTASSLVSKTVEYYCVSNSSSYIITNSNDFGSIEDKESLFPEGSTSNIISRCAFDDSKTRPPSPIFDNNTNTCNNAVLDVNYQVQWNGAQLRSVKAKVTLGSFPASTVTLSPATYTYYTTRVVIVTPSIGPSVTSIHSSSATLIAVSSAVRSPIPSNITSSYVNANASSSNQNLTSTISTGRLQQITTTLAPALTRNRSSIALSPSPSSTSHYSSPANITYSNVTITIRISTVIYRNITVLPSVLQRFAVSFSYAKVAASSIASASPSTNAATSTAVHRSGNPGYVLGMPLISQTLNSTKTTLGLLMWKPSKSGLCSEATTTPIQFGKDTTSGCLLRFGVDQFANCSSLVELVQQSQDQLVKAIRIAKRGNPSVRVAADWLNIISVPAAQNTVNLTRNGICHNIPSRLFVEILIAEAGMLYGQSQMEISGVRVSYKTETWSMPCTSGANAKCYNTTEANSQFTNPLLRTFAVTSTVSFVTIPAVEPPGVKRSVDMSGICRYDACIQELFYPIRNTYSTGVIEFNLALTQNATAMAVTLIFIAFGALFVSRPWRN